MLYPQFYFDILNTTIERFYYPNYFWAIFAFLFFTLFAIFSPKQKQKKACKKSKYQYHNSSSQKETKQSKNNLWFRCSIAVFGVILMIGGIIYTNIEINEIKSDIKNEDFIVYTGSFEYWYRGTNNLGVINFLDTNEINTDSVHLHDRYNHYSTYETDNYQSLEKGIYHGSVIYSKESKIVVELQIVKED